MLGYFRGCESSARGGTAAEWRQRLRLPLEKENHVIPAGTPSQIHSEWPFTQWASALPVSVLASLPCCVLNCVALRCRGTLRPCAPAEGTHTLTRTNGKLLNSLLFSNGLRLFTHQYQILQGSLFVWRRRFGILQVHTMIGLCFGLRCAARTTIFHWHCVLSGEAHSFVLRCVCFCSNFSTHLSEHTGRSYRFRRQ